VDKKMHPMQIFLYSLPLFPILAIIFGFARYIEVAVFLGLFFLLEIAFVFVLNARGKKTLISHIIEISDITEDKHVLYLGSTNNPLYFAIQKHDNVTAEETLRKEEQENFDTVVTDTMGEISNKIERERLLIDMSKALKENGRIVLCDKTARIQQYAAMLGQMHWNDVGVEQNSYPTLTSYSILTAYKPGVITE